MLNTLAILVIAASASVQLPHRIQHDGIRLELLPRTPDQMASFYEARGFPVEMIDVLKQQCFITVRLHNLHDDILWLELANWSFSVDGKPLERLHRDAWKQRWQAMDMPLPSQSTFRWTLLPETLDYLPDEQEGGNIILPRVGGDIKLHATFKTGNNKDGAVINIDYNKLRCAL